MDTKLFRQDDRVDVAIQIDEIASAIFARVAMEVVKIINDPDLSRSARTKPAPFQHFRARSPLERERGIFVTQTFTLKIGLVL